MCGKCQALQSEEGPFFDIFYIIMHKIWPGDEAQHKSSLTVQSWTKITIKEKMELRKMQPSGSRGCHDEGSSIVYVLECRGWLR